jgi:AcrR family transcriptional regulator
MRGRARDALLAAAVQCIYEKGYTQTTQRDLLAASGANARSITYHFGSKDRLMASALAEIFRRRSEPVLEAGERAGGPPLRQFTDVFVALLERVTANRELAFALADGVAQTRSEELREVFGDHYGRVRRRIGVLIRTVVGDRYEAAGGDVDALSAALLALVDGLVLQWVVDPDSVPDAELIMRSLTIAFAVVAEDGGSRGGGPAP